MIDIEEGLARAKAAIVKIYGRDLPGLEVEEIEDSSDSECWLVTLGFWEKESRPRSDADPALAGFLNPYRRKYKTMVVRKNDGEVTAMKMREPELESR